jgi:site-specific recombinase XerD
MAKKRFHQRRPRAEDRLRSKELAEDMAVIHGDFADHLRARHYAPLTVDHYQRHMVRVACWLREHRRHPTLSELTRRMVPRLLAQVLPCRSQETRMNYRKAVFHWLRFKGRYSEPVVRPWASWLIDYLQFLRTHQGVGQSTLEFNEDNAKAFMQWQFGTGQANWSQVKPTDLWSFARDHIRGVKPSTGKARLGYVRRFLRFVHLKGACGPQLAAAIPKVAICGGPRRPEILTRQQRCKLLASFERTTPESKRNYAMILCMLDLGLRGGEVMGLRLQDIDWQARWLNVRVTKTGRGRRLPLPAQVLEALRDYVKTGRPQNTPFDHVFLRHPHRRGYPLSRSVLKSMVRLAYRRCGFPPTWSGTHRLRHSFASRLHQRGVDMKPIADLLGHRRLDSTNIYTQVNIEALRALAKPWPW